MNDDFLYRLRTEPPEHFAVQLKERLDRSSKRGARVWRFGLGVLLLGTAFAMPTLIDWIKGSAPASAVTVPDDTPQGLARAFADPIVEHPDTPVSATDEEVRRGVLALLEELQRQRQRPAELPSVIATPEVAIETNESTATAPDGADGRDAASAAEEAQSELIVTGPLLAEVGTPAYVYDARRAYFTVLAMTMNPLDQLLARPTPAQKRAAIVAATRLAALTPMMSEVFARDERGSNVPTLSKDEVWAQRSEFAAQLVQFGKAVQGLSQVVRSNDQAALGKQIVRVNAQCSSCHEKFRKGGDHDVGTLPP
jgi:cytochrome c556